MILTNIRKFLLNCPYLEGGRINADFLSENPPAYAVYAENGEKNVKVYTDGSSLEQFIFSFRMRAEYSKQISQNEKISLLFENISDWITEEAQKGNFPDIGQDKEIQNLEVVSSGHIKNTNAADCVYEMKCRILYYRR